MSTQKYHVHSFLEHNANIKFSLTKTLQEYIYKSIDKIIFINIRLQTAYLLHYIRFFSINQFSLGIFEILTFKKVSKRTYNSGPSLLLLQLFHGKLLCGLDKWVILNLSSLSIPPRSLMTLTKVESRCHWVINLTFIKKIKLANKLCRHSTFDEIFGMLGLTRYSRRPNTAKSSPSLF